MKLTHYRLAIPFLVLLIGSTQADDQAPETAASADGIAFFEKKIRPVLIEHCYGCHSQTATSANKLRGGLLLDSRAGVLKGGESGPVLIPGKPAESLMLDSLKYDGLEMPPKGKLPAAIVADFEKWIALGAPDPRIGKVITTAGIDMEAGRNHWSYRPLKRPPIPQTRLTADSPIDAFLLARLASHELQQNAVADREVLVRRLYFDLTGLPPTPDQIAEFVNDTAPDAYIRLVDRLMASPRFGERWGRQWLDVVRYAESITLRGFVFPEAWRYRDYVIDAFNADRPFDRFVREQIAGDLLPAESLEERQRNLIATTFLTMGNNNLEDQDKGKLRMDVVDEQLETIGRGFLAQTIGCARCHDHKFDPIPTSDYYALAGILRNTKTLIHANVSKWIELPLPMEADRELEFKKYETEVALIQGRIKQLKAKVKGGKPSAASPLPLDQVPGVVVDDAQARLTGVWNVSQFTKTYVGSGYRHDSGQPKGENTAVFAPMLAADGEYEVRFAYTPGTNRSPAVPITVNSEAGEKTVTVNQRNSPPIDDRFISLGTYRFKQADKPTVTVTNTGTTDVVIIDAVQFLPIELAKAKPTTKKPTGKKPSAKVSDKSDAIRKQELQQLEKELKALTQQAPSRPMCMSVQEEDKIEDVKIHIRGNVHNLGPLAPRGFLQVADFESHPTLSSKQSGRRELGDWIADRRNPLTSRVLANRLWLWLFGSGLVRTPDNFGTTGQTPSHPELLDYLASRLLEQDWSVKNVLREIVLSRAYRLSSGPNPRGLVVDPENRLLWRMNRRRLTAENLLDSMLAINGQLKSEFGGSMIRANTSNDYDYSHAGNRRAVYWPVFRNSLPDIFDVFDFANPSMVVGRRDISNSAPQALFMMNNPWVLEQAQFAANKFLGDRQLDDHQRLHTVFLATLGRHPSPNELAATLAFVESSEQDDAQLRLKWAQVIQTLFASMDFRYIR
ncbi:MAG: DUF1553 domain-containing protein [Planctomycetota bacterium]|nr:DUF1553 domain-containing protein [Planctomycetota bacterium]